MSCAAQQRFVLHTCTIQWNTLLHLCNKSDPCTQQDPRFEWFLCMHRWKMWCGALSANCWNSDCAFLCTKCVDSHSCWKHFQQITEIKTLFLVWMVLLFSDAGPKFSLNQSSFSSDTIRIGRGQRKSHMSVFDGVSVPPATTRDSADVEMTSFVTLHDFVPFCWIVFQLRVKGQPRRWKLNNKSPLPQNASSWKGKNKKKTSSGLFFESIS